MKCSGEAAPFRPPLSPSLFFFLMGLSLAGASPLLFFPLIRGNKRYFFRRWQQSIPETSLPPFPSLFVRGGGGPSLFSLFLKFPPGRGTMTIVPISSFVGLFFFFLPEILDVRRFWYSSVPPFSSYVNWRPPPFSPFPPCRRRVLAIFPHFRPRIIQAWLLASFFFSPAQRGFPTPSKPFPPGKVPVFPSFSPLIRLWGTGFSPFFPFVVVNKNIFPLHRTD